MPPKNSQRFIARSGSGPNANFHSAINLNDSGPTAYKGTSVKPSAKRHNSRVKSLRHSGVAVNIVFGNDIPCVWTDISMCAVYYLACVLTLGFLWIMTVPYPRIREWFTLRQVNPEAATVCSILVEGKWESGEVQLHEHGLGGMMASVVILGRRYLAYSSKAWKLFAVEDVPNDFIQRVHAATGVGKAAYIAISREMLQTAYGPNEISLPKVSFLIILAKILFHPFYLFQYFAIIVWLAQEYRLYSLVTATVTAGAIMITASVLKDNLNRMRLQACESKSISRFDPQTGKITRGIDSELLPGDCIVLQPDLELPCDAFIIRGGCTVDESMLTGVSTVVTKTALNVNSSLANQSLDINEHSENLLLGGTKILQTYGKSSDTGDCPVIGIVYKTGFLSKKGQLVSSLLSNKDIILG